MVCKEEVCTWFRDLQGPKRLEFMCGLLQMCLPLELRFIGSCVEDLAKKDYYYLRDAENRANDPEEVKKLTDIFCRETRGKINTYLALIHSSNTVCSNSLYHNTLTCMLPTLEKLYPNLPTDSDFRNEIILSLTMAAYHPSFTFSQRHRLFTELLAVKKLLEDQSPTDCSSTTNAGCSSSSSSSSKHIAVSASPNNIHCSKTHSNGDNNSQNSHNISSNNVNSNGNISSNSDSKGDKGLMPDSNDILTTVFVQRLEVKGSQVRQDRKNEFIIQVTWSDGQVTKAYRTYQQLHQFHTELIKLFPKESGAHRQERQIPFFPQDKGPSHNHSDMESHIKKYIRQLSELQDHIVQCEHVTTFFRSSPTTSVSPYLTSPLTSPMVASQHTVTIPQTRASMTSTSPLTIKVDPSASSSSHSPRSLSASHTANNSPLSYSCSPYPLIHGSPSSSTSSSLPSPSSAHMSPSSQTHQDAHSPSSTKDIASWLKEIRLHKYTQTLSKYTWDDIMSLTEEQLEEEGLTVGARKKFFTKRSLRSPSQSMPNGVINFESGVNIPPQSPLSPSAYFTPPQSCLAYDQRLSDGSHPNTPPPTGGESGNLSGIDTSSDSSPSPPKTPDPEMKPESLSSEETDRDVPEIEMVGTMGKPTIHDGLLPPPNLHHNQLPPEFTHFPMRTNNGGLLTMPPGMRGEAHTSNNAFHQLPTHMDMKTLAETLPLQYPVGVRPLLPPAFLESPYFHHRHVRPPRSQVPHGQAVKPMTLSNNVGSNTTPVMQTPKMPSGTSGVIFENGHQIPPAQSFSYVPNHSQGHVHPHGVPLGPVPHPHHPKVNGQYAEGASTPPSMTPSMTTATDTVTYKAPSGFVPPTMITSHGGPPMSSMSGPSLARPSTLGTLASTSLTYSMPHIQHVTVDSNGKQQPPQQGPPNQQHPPQQPSPAALPNQVKSPAGLEFNSYNPNVQGTPQSSNNASYSSPTSTPGLQRVNPPTPPAAPPPGGAPQPPHHPPQRTGTPNNSSSCSSCGCHGNCNNTAPPTPTNTVLPPYAYHYANMWPWQHAFMHGHLPYLHGGTNGLINHSLPFPPSMPPNIPNGFSSELLYNNHHNFVVPGVHSQGQNTAGPFMAFNPNQISVNQGSNTNSGNKKAMCYNCGQSGHRPYECEKPTMENIAHPGSYHLKIRPKPQDAE